MADTPRCGRWDSPLTPAAVAAGSGGPSWPSVVGAETWWCAADTADASVRLLRWRAPQPRESAASAAPSAASASAARDVSSSSPLHDVLGPPWKVSNGAIGYGGRPYLAVAAAAPADPHLLVFTEASDHRLYAARVAPLSADSASATASVAAAAAPVPLTPPDPAVCTTCYADPVLGPDGTEVWCVREVTRTDLGVGCDPAEITVREIVAVPLDGSGAADPDAVRVLLRSHHFLTCVRVGPGGDRLSWIGWNHPDMPWDSSELMVARLEDGAAGPVAGPPVRVLGGSGSSVPQAEWADATTLYAMADPDGWWNLHRVTLDESAGAADGFARVACVLPMRSECAHAVWRVGATSFAVCGERVVFRHGVGDQQLVAWDPAGDGALTELAPGWTEFAVGVSGSAEAFAVVGASPTRAPTPLRIDVATGIVQPCSGVAAGEPEECEPWYATPERRTAPGREGRTVHFTYYPPTNPRYAVAPDELPPLIIDVHGGPTSTTGAARSPVLSLFTSRGFAVASVDYGGSTGYGRAYRDLLRGTWGVVDVEDSVSVVQALAGSGLADARRVAIRGGSAGGWTTLAALTHAPDTFRCGAIRYPIADPFTWYAGETHDFESRYQDTLLGGAPGQADAFYRRVSPLLAVGQLRAPFVMMHGLDDTICHPDQSERFVAAARALHGEDICRAYLRFPDEGHGFRHAATLAAALEAELALFTEVLV